MATNQSSRPDTASESHHGSHTSGELDPFDRRVVTWLESRAEAVRQTVGGDLIAEERAWVAEDEAALVLTAMPAPYPGCLSEKFAVLERCLERAESPEAFVMLAGIKADVWRFIFLRGE